MKNLLKIGALSLALIATIFMLNRTNAATGPVTLELTAGVSSCVYGTSINLGTHAVSYAAFNMTGSNFTPATRYCTDNTGKASWALTVQLTDDLTNTNAQSIPTGNVYMFANQNYVQSGSCTAGTTQLTSRAAIDTAKVVLEKTAAAGQICTITSTGVNLAVAVPAAQPVGLYTGTLTVTLPVGF